MDDSSDRRLPLKQTTKPSARSGHSQLAVFVASLSCFVFAFLVLPFVYSAIAVQEDFLNALTDARGPHIFANACLTGLVMVTSIRLKGRLDRKLATVLGRTLVIFGGLALFTLITRSFHSNTVMLISIATSVVLGNLVMLMRHVSERPRLALLGPWSGLAKDLPSDFHWIEYPGTDLSGYDVLLTTGVVDLSGDWSYSLSQAMLRGRQVRHVAEFIEESQGIVSVEHFDLEHIPSNGLTSYRTRKRIMDIGLVLLSLPLTVPLVIVGAVAVLVSMGSPVLFQQTRVGQGQKPFRIYKLRTMRPASPSPALTATTCGDPRITKVGRLLRRYRIDELPQVWNVLKGDMSVIGPRPEEASLSEAYVKLLPAYVYRSLVRPGITGWAQVRFGYASTIEETTTKLSYDLFYIKNFSFALDVQILTRTVWTLLTGTGAR